MIGSLISPATDPSYYGYSSYQSMAQDCSSLGNWLIHSACWGKSPGQWAIDSNFPNPPLPSPPGAPTTIAQETMYGDFTPQQALDMGKQNSLDQLKAFFGNLLNPQNPQDDSNTINWLLVGLVVGGIILIKKI